MSEKPRRILVVGCGSSRASTRMALLALAVATSVEVVDVSPPCKLASVSLRNFNPWPEYKLKGRFVDSHQQPWYRRQRNGKPARY